MKPHETINRGAFENYVTLKFYNLILKFNDSFFGKLRFVLKILYQN